MYLKHVYPVLPGIESDFGLQVCAKQQIRISTLLGVLRTDAEKHSYRGPSSSGGLQCPCGQRQATGNEGQDWEVQPAQYEPR